MSSIELATGDHLFIDGFFEVGVLASSADHCCCVSALCFISAFCKVKEGATNRWHALLLYFVMMKQRPQWGRGYHGAEIDVSFSMIVRLCTVI